MLSGGFAAGATSDSREASALVEAKLLFASGQWDLASQRLERVMHRDDFEEGDADNAEIFYLYSKSLFEICKAESLEDSKDQFMEKVGDKLGQIDPVLQAEFSNSGQGGEGGKRADEDGDGEDSLIRVTYENAECARILLEKTNPESKLMLKILQLIAEINIERQIFDMALEDLERCFKICECLKIQDCDQLFSIHLGMGNCHTMLLDFSAAREQFTLCLKLLDESSHSKITKQTIKAEIQEKMLDLKQAEIEKDAKNVEGDSIENKPTSGQKMVDVTHLFDKENVAQEQPAAKTSAKRSFEETSNEVSVDITALLSKEPLADSNLDQQVGPAAAKLPKVQK